MKKLIFAALLALIACTGAAHNWSAADDLEVTCNSTPDSWMPVFELDQDLYLENSIVCTTPIILEGNGYTINGPGGLHFLAGASWSSVRDLRFRGDGSGVAIDIEAHGVRLSNLWVDGWEYGIRAWSTGPNRGNANGQSWRDLWISNNAVAGIYLDGGDSNAGLFENLETRNNGVHVWDSSFLGNTYIAGISDGNGVYKRFDSAANYSTLLGTYVEGDPIPVSAMELVGYPLIVGGSTSIWSSIFYGRSTVNPHGYSRLGFQSMGYGLGSAGNVKVTIPGGPESAFAVAHRSENFYHWKVFKWIEGWKSWLVASYLGSGTHPFRFTGNTHPSGPGHATVNP